MHDDHSPLGFARRVPTDFPSLWSPTRRSIVTAHRARSLAARPHSVHDVSTDQTADEHDDSNENSKHRLARHFRTRDTSACLYVCMYTNHKLVIVLFFNIISSASKREEERERERASE